MNLLQNKKTIIILSLLSIVCIAIILKYTLVKTENFTNYDNFEYSDKMTVDDIKNLKKGQVKMNNMLKIFDKICIDNNIRYFLIAGSCLGSVLYKGWIPWDADIDLEVYEGDYDKLKTLLKTELPKNMWFQDNDTDKYYPKNSNIIGKIRDLNSCYIEYTNNGGTQWHNGIQIDVNIYKILPNGSILFPDQIRTNYLTINDIYPIKRVKFEDFNVNIMKNSEKYLDRNYGKGWRKILPIEERYPHEGLIDSDNTCKFHINKYPELYKITK